LQVKFARYCKLRQFINIKNLIYMKKNYSSKKSAFSLIELSIVLIIIGLLIAGITGGASLIKSSELRSVIGEARGYAVAVNAFFTQYDALPGDFSTSISAGDVVGNQNARIEYATNSEGTEAWRDLKTAGAIDSILTITNANTAQAPSVNIPASKTKSNGWAFDSNNTDFKNYVIITGAIAASADANNSLINGAFKSTGALLPTDALSIDAKTDDGKPNTGKVLGVLSTCFTGATYTVATTTKVCALSFNIDVNS
jgi:prepilin-type N-terminal cleavage/methylation domain-containing protein